MGKLKKEQRKLLMLSSLGGILEMYDFIIFALLAEYLSLNFFPKTNEFMSLLAVFATFSIGYLVRPLGGIVMGHFGDRIGRKKIFTISILIMACATFCIGLVPPYSTLGITSPIILTLLRVLQGLSIGGEIPGSIAYVSETFPREKGFATGLVQGSVIFGIAAGSLVQAVLTNLLSNDQMAAYGFRIPFFIGGLFGLMSCRLRAQLEESPLFINIEHKIERFPVITVFKRRLRNTLCGLCFAGFGAARVTLLFLFIPTYINKILKISTTSYLWYNTAAICVSALLIVFFGWLTDRFNHRYLLIGTCLLALLLAIPIFTIYVHFFNLAIIALGFSALLQGMGSGVVQPILAELFPTTIRYSGIALTYNLGNALFGGFTPLIATALIYRTGILISPAYYLMLVAAISLIGAMFYKAYKLHD